MATKKTKKPVKKTKRPVPPKDIWTQDRVRALYKMEANIPLVNKLPDGNGTTHMGEPHEWEWEGDPSMPPVCLGCNATGDYVERVQKYGGESYEEDLLDDGFGDDFLDSRYF